MKITTKTTRKEFAAEVNRQEKEIEGLNGLVNMLRHQDDMKSKRILQLESRLRKRSETLAAVVSEHWIKSIECDHVIEAGQ